MRISFCGVSICRQISESFFSLFEAQLLPFFPGTLLVCLRGMHHKMIKFEEFFKPLLVQGFSGSRRVQTFFFAYGAPAVFFVHHKQIAMGMLFVGDKQTFLLEFPEKIIERGSSPSCEFRQSCNVDIDFTPFQVNTVCVRSVCEIGIEQQVAVNVIGVESADSLKLVFDNCARESDITSRHRAKQPFNSILFHVLIMPWTNRGQNVDG